MKLKCNRCGHCTLCKLAEKDGRYRIIQDRIQTDQPTESRNVVAPKSLRMVHCRHLGDRVEFRAGCNSGWMCRHKCNLYGKIEDTNLISEVLPGDECQDCDHYIAKGESLVLVNALSPGDVVVMSAAIESLIKAHPRKYLIAVRSTAQEIWEHDPRVVPEAGLTNPRILPMHYPYVHQSDSIPHHFMHGYTAHLSRVLEIPFTLAVNRPVLHLSESECSTQLVEGPYWIVNAGMKSDYTAKYWGSHNFQDVVSRLRSQVRFLQIGEVHHNHKLLEGVEDWRGKTTMRQLMQLVYHSRGGLGPSTLLQHLCAAFEKPYVLLAGGREPRSWQTYPRQTMFSTVGQLPCCQLKACWKSRTVPIGDGDDKDKPDQLCELPVVREDGSAVPKCLEMIRPEDVVRAITSYHV